MNKQRSNKALSLLAPGMLSALLVLACGCGSDEPDETVDPKTPEASCLTDSETGKCASEALASVHLTYLNVNYDLSKPVYVNNRVPISFGLTGKKAKADDADLLDIAVSFSFIEAEPEDPKEPIECASNALVVGLDFDEKEHQFSGNVWPTTLCQELVGKKVTLRVRFNGGAELEENLSVPTITLSDKQAALPLNQLCRKTEDASAADNGRGCAYTVDLQSTPKKNNEVLIDVLYAGMTPDSAVAVLPLEPQNGEGLTESLTVQSTFVVNGRDPYMSGARPEDVPEELEKNEPGITEELQFGLPLSDIDAFAKLPGKATIKYAIAPADAPDDIMPLLISDPESDNPDVQVEAVTVEELFPGTPNVFTHSLFAQGETRTALESGRWKTISDFVVRGCFEAQFEQSGNEGYKVENSDCKVVPITMVREVPSESSASAFTFQKTFGKGVGNRNRLHAGAQLETSNKLDANGVSSSVEGRLVIEGKLGRRFKKNIVRAFGSAVLNTTGVGSNYELGVDVFDIRVFSVADEVGDTYSREKDFSVGKSFPFPNMGFGFGPVRIGLQVKVGGEVSFNTADELRAISDNGDCQDELNTDKAMLGCGTMSRIAGPGFNFTVEIDGGINLRVVKAGIRAKLKLAEIQLPLVGKLAFGVADGGGVMVRGEVNLDTVFRLISGKIAIYGKIGVRRFARRRTVTLFNFHSKTIRTTLLKRSTNGLQDLQ